MFYGIHSLLRIFSSSALNLLKKYCKTQHIFNFKKDKRIG